MPNCLGKEAFTFVNLAIWKAKLDEIEEVSVQMYAKKEAKIDAASVRQERRTTPDASM